MTIYDLSMNYSMYYRCSNIGLFLPLINESSWSDGWRAVLYFIGLIYTFFGLAVASDILMCAIERITSQTVITKMMNKKLGSTESIDDDSEKADRSQESYIWNPTVTRLTLIALGSSTPEIFLTFIESAEQEFRAGSLGPSTIVGSAAFNAFIVTAICMLAVPAAQTRRISQVSVLITTTVISLFAFGWLLIILKAVTPDVIEIWEALLTLLFFIPFVLLAYVADKNFCMKKVSFPNVVGKWKRNGVQSLPQNKEGQPKEVAEDQPVENGLGPDFQTKQTIVTPDENQLESRRSSDRLRTAAKRSMNGLKWDSMNRECAKQNPNADAVVLSHVTAQKIDASKSHTNTYYRILAIRALAAGKRQLMTNPLLTKVEPIPLPVERVENAPNESLKLSTIEFAANKYAVVDNDTNVRLKVLRSGRVNKRVLFKYETFDGSAKRGKDYVSRTETLVFNPGETEKFITVEVLPDHEKEADDIFFVKLGLEDFADGRTAIGPNNVAQIIIGETERDTKLQFAQSSLIVKESVGTIRVAVVRKGNSKLKATINWSTVADTAKDGRDFIGGNGVLEFDVGEVEKQIAIRIIDDKELEKHETFDIVLSDPSEGASLSSKKRKCTVTILNDDDTTLLLTQSDHLVSEQLDALQPGGQSWRQQFVIAANVNGGDVQNANALDYLLHVVTFMWKLLFAFIPPPSLGGGAPTLIVSLTVIGLLTVLLRDLAAVFGCVVGLHDCITAIVIVAIGTNIPDLSASRLAARREKSADAAVAHILSNSAFTVFVGLGTSWLISSLYWNGRDRPFTFASGDFAFSVALYLLLVIIGIILMIVRRNLSVFGYAELGGSMMGRFCYSAILFLLWGIFIALCTLQTYGVLYKNH